MERVEQMFFQGSEIWDKWGDGRKLSTALSESTLLGPPELHWRVLTGLKDENAKPQGMLSEGLWEIEKLSGFFNEFYYLQSSELYLILGKIKQMVF